MDKYTMMRISDKFDDDGIDECDLNLDSRDGRTDTELFKRDYSDFYDDVKHSDREDW